MAFSSDYWLLWVEKREEIELNLTLLTIGITPKAPSPF